MAIFVLFLLLAMFCVVSLIGNVLCCFSYWQCFVLFLLLAMFCVVSDIDEFFDFGVVSGNVKF